MIRIEPKEAEKPAEGHQNLAGPTRREWRFMNPQYTNVKVDSLIPY